MSKVREDFLSHLTEAERLHEDGLTSKEWPPRDDIEEEEMARINAKVKASIIHIAIRGPDRTMIDEYEAKPTKIAKDFYDQEPAVIFIRDDGWSLGASKKLVHAAERIWRDKWAAVMVKHNGAFHGYQEWCLSREEFVEALP